MKNFQIEGRAAVADLGDNVVSALLDGLAREYHTVWLIGGADRRMRLYRTTGRSTLKAAVQLGLDLVDYDTAMHKYVYTMLHEEDRERVWEEVRFSTLEKNVPDVGIYVCNYRRCIGDGKIDYHQACFAKAVAPSGSVNYVLGFRDADTEIRQQLSERKSEHDLQKALVDCIRLRVEKEPSPAVVDELLKELGEFYDADRAYVFEMAEGGVINNTYEYCAPGVVSQRENLQGVPLSVLAPWMDAFRRFGAFSMKELTAAGAGSEDILKILEPQNIHSLVTAPFLMRGEVVGLIGIDNPRHAAEDVYLVRAVATMIQSEIARIERNSRTAAELERALALAESASRAKTAFLSNMSHDIRTPMNAIIGFARLASAHVDEPERMRDYLSKITESSNHLLSLINDVLDMSRIEAGKMTIGGEPHDLREIIASIKDILQANAAARELDLQVDDSGVEDRYVICDKLRLDQVLLNIASNAIKYTRPGGRVGIRVSQLPATREGCARFEFSVADNGIGMTPEFLKTIYDPFTRMQSATVSGIEGTGLGMSITKRIVDLMGGSIDIQSELNRGTTVTVFFEFALTEPPRKEQPAAAGDFTGKKVLLVEDIELNRIIASELLGMHGLTVVEAVNGKEAVEKLAQAKRGDIDLVLMDVQMPVMDGYEATRRIRALGTWAAELPILAMTANAFTEDRQQALAAGMNDHIAKPVNPDQLVEKLSKYLDGSRHPLQ